MRRTAGIPNAGKRFRDEMLKKDISTKQIHEDLGISFHCIRHFIYADSNISSANLAKMCEYIGVSADYIMGLKE